jgi:hypothetical protein
MRRIQIYMTDSTFHRLGVVADRKGVEPRYLAGHILDVALTWVDKQDSVPTNANSDTSTLAGRVSPQASQTY